MESELQSRFRKLNGQLRSLATVNVRTIAELMWSAEHLSLEELDAIKPNDGGCSVASKLLDYVYRRGDKSIKGFAQALRKIEMDKLADELCSEAPSTPVPPPPPSLPPAPALSPTHSVSDPAASWQNQHFCFGAVSASIPLPISCHDLALTKDGRLLLAAAEHGLIEVCLKKGNELSRWRPPKLPFLYFFESDDMVTHVAALSDGRAAVSLHWAQLVVLLRRSEEGGKDGANLAGYPVWTEDHRFHKLPWTLSRLSAQGDMLAVAGGRELHLMRNNRGRWLTTAVHRQYNIDLMLVSDKVLVTGCISYIFFNQGSMLDAHSLDDLYPRLWHHRQEHIFRDICADSTGGCLYAAVWIREFKMRLPHQSENFTCDRVSTLSLVDGSELRRFALKCAYLDVLMAESLSLLDCGTTEMLQEQSGSSSTANSDRRNLLLALLCSDRWDGLPGCRTVVVHRSRRCVTEVQQ